MADTASLIKGAMAQASSGAVPTSNTLSPTDTGIGDSSAKEDYEDVVTSSDSKVDDPSEGSDDTPNPGSLEDKAAAKSKETPDKELITITDDKGRRKVEVNYADRAAIRKAFEVSHGARKWQAERDKAISTSKAQAQELAKVKSDFQVLDEAFKRGGAEEVFDLLQGRKGAFQESVRKQQERAEFMRTASPEEKDALITRELAEKHSRELAQARKENEEFRKEIQTERENAELRSLEARVHPSFNKHRFADKLGDADDEQMFDEMLWNTALKQLEPYEEQGLEITPELVNQKMSEVAGKIRKRIASQADRKAGAAIAQKKQEATENVQSKLMTGYSKQNNKAQDYLNRGDTSGLIRNWSSMFGKK